MLFYLPPTSQLMGQRGQIKEDELNLGGLQAHCVKPNKSRSKTGQMERSLTHLLWRNISIPQTTSYSHFYQKQLQLKFHSGPSEHQTVQRNDNSGGGHNLFLYHMDFV